MRENTSFLPQFVSVRVVVRAMQNGSNTGSDNYGRETCGSWAPETGFQEEFEGVQ